jgi:clan AA aspartic protease
MGLIRTEIELINTDDVALFNAGYRTKEQIRVETVSALVDSGAYLLCINEVIKNQMGLKLIETDVATLADGKRQTFDIVGPITVKFKNRTTICRALVLPGDSEVLLGAIPMEDMDVVINPRSQTLEINPQHPYIAGTILKGIRKN